MFLVCAVIAVLLGTAHSQCTRLPTKNEIRIAVNLFNRGTTVDLTHHLTCIAPTQRLGEIRYVSIAVKFKLTTDMHGDNITRRQHIVLLCSGVNNWETWGIEGNPPAVAFNLTTREDCLLCEQFFIPGVDTDANCAGESLSDLILYTCT